MIVKSPEHFLIDAYCQKGMQEKHIYITTIPKILKREMLLV